MNKEYQYERVFRALGDGHRLTILKQLAQREMNAGEILETVDVVQSTLSHHMKTLCESGLVIPRKNGKWTCYTLDRQVFQDAAQYLGFLCSEEDLPEISPKEITAEKASKEKPAEKASKEKSAEKASKEIPEEKSEENKGKALRKKIGEAAEKKLEKDSEKKLADPPKAAGDGNAPGNPVPDMPESMAEEIVYSSETPEPAVKQGKKKNSAGIKGKEKKDKARVKTKDKDKTKDKAKDKGRSKNRDKAKDGRGKKNQNG